MEIPTASVLISPNVREKALSRRLSFAERVAHQYAVEEVYWRHRIWPKDNLGPKSRLEVILSQRQIQQKVQRYLRKSKLVTDQRGCPITPSELQAEMDRMAQHTKRPDVLRELFAALGNDPLVIAECLAKPALAERLIANLRVVAGVPPAAMNSFAAGTAPSTKNDTGVTASMDNAEYKLPEIVVLADCADDTWTPTSTANASDGRIFYPAVWTGSEMIVWGGFNFNGRLNTGGKYDPTTDSWVPTNVNNAPSPRDYHSAVWTGTEMIIWGGEPILNTGGRYNPVTDSWTATSTTNAPTARAAHTAVWTGSEMIVWGGRHEVGWFNTGGRYNPNTDSWIATSTINAPEARWAHTVEWTGSEMIVWGGTNQTIYLNTGAKYDPTDNSWMATSTANAPLGRVGHTAVWSGSEMSVWGGTDSTFNDTNTGGRYNPTADNWMVISTANAPSARDSHTAVWTGSEMIIWGGVFCCPAIDFNTGGKYNVGTDSWTATNIANAPLARWSHTAVWTGNEMIAWGGYNDPNNLFPNTGGRYCAQSGATPTPTAPATATPTPTATATATATPPPRIAPTPRNRPTPPPRP
jgi:N-acetylneuraminic acid mutarotase